MLVEEIDCNAMVVETVRMFLGHSASSAVSVNVEPEPRGHVVFTVTDTGIGIPADRLHAIFEAFEQVDGTTSRQYGGTGRGLTISRTLCDLINATLTVESSVGVGSTFRVTCAPVVRRLTPPPARLGGTPIAIAATGVPR